MATTKARTTRSSSGPGHNGLIAAAYMAKAGLRVLVLEARAVVGGAAVTEEIGPGPRPGARAHRRAAAPVGRARPGARRLRARARRPRGAGVRARSRTGGGDALGGPRPQRRGAARLLRGRRHRVGRVRPERAVAVASSSPTSVTGAARGQGAGLRGRAPGPAARSGVPRPGQARRAHDPACPRDGGRGLRVGVVRDEAIRGDARLARRPVHRHGALVRRDHLRAPRRRRRQRRRGRGRDRVREGRSVGALGGAGRCGAGRRRGDPHRCEGRAITTRDGRDGCRARLRRGDRRRPSSPASTPSAADGARRPGAVGPTMRWRAGNIRTPGAVAKVNLVLDGLPEFPAAGGDAARLRGRIQVGTPRSTRRARVRRVEVRALSEAPILEATIPSLVDPSLVEGAPEGTHVISVDHAVDAAKAIRARRLGRRRDESAISPCGRSRQWRPGLGSRVAPARCSRRPTSRASTA